MPFSQEERHFYNRPLKLPDFGEAHQALLKQARVLCVGAGGLGAPCLQYLARAGVGTIGVVDFDTIDVSNLHRQVLYDYHETSQNKVEVTAAKLRAANPFIEVETHSVLFDHVKGLALAEGYDLLIDGTDNFASRYAVNQVAIERNQPVIFGAVQEFEAQIGLFKPTTHPCFRCVFPAPPPPELAANCAENGIIGTVPGVLGVMQAHLAILYLSGLYTGTYTELLHFDLLTFQLQTRILSKNPHCPSCSRFANPHSIQEFFMSLNQPVCGDAEGEISPATLANLLKQPNAEYVLIDVRNTDEHARGHLGGMLIPLPTLHARMAEFPKTAKIIVYCQKGIRSKMSADALRASGFLSVQHLAGGMDAWQK